MQITILPSVGGRPSLATRFEIRRCRVRVLVSINKWPRPLPRRTRLLWARLVLLAWRGFFRARTVATARVQTYTRMSGAGRSILPLVDNFRFGRTDGVACQRQ